MPATATVSEAVTRMIGSTRGAVLVSDDSKTHQGTFTERDLMTKIVGEGLSPDVTPLGSVMNGSPKYLSERATIADAIRILRDNHIRHLPVLNDADELVGMISLRHLLYDHIQYLLEGIQSLAAYLNDAPGG